MAINTVAIGTNNIITALLEIKMKKSPLVFVGILASYSAFAQGLGVSSIGATGGLNIPSAYVLNSGEASISLGNEQDARLGSYSLRRNSTLGFGLGGGVELFGRLAEYQNPTAVRPHEQDVHGPRDISGNLKWAVPLPIHGLPKLAVGVTDVSGGAVYFKSAYAVASDEFSWLRWSLGVAKGKNAVVGSGAKVLDGVFGGVEARIWDTRATALAESDGGRRHLGLRYYSEPLDWLTGGQLIGSVQLSTLEKAQGVARTEMTSVNATLVLPLGASDVTREKRIKKVVAAMPLPSLAARAGAKNQKLPADKTAQTDQLAALVSALKNTGLDRIRVGLLGSDLVVEFENHRYLHNEVDALGVIFGLASELAPAYVQRVYAISLKSGVVVFEGSVDAANYRAVLRDDAEAVSVKSKLGFGQLSGYDASAVQWVNQSQKENIARITLRPILNYTLGTEYGLFDYSLALQTRTSTSLWRGAEAYADLVEQVANSSNMEYGGIFASSRFRSGLRNVAVQQAFWLSPNWVTSVGGGMYDFHNIGVEGESIFFIPASDDTVHLRGRSTRRTDSDPLLPKVLTAGSASYRWRLAPDTWLEGGINAYTDDTRGPSLTLTRWFGDTALNMYVRKGRADMFVGVEVSLPLTPREGLAASTLQVSGSPRFDLSFRTLVASGANKANYVRPNAVRGPELTYRPEVELLNSGRITPEYVQSQLPRMKEAFYLYGRNLLP
jgi:hypothetical protein